MGAFVKHEFKKGFLLDEERVRKIHEIFITRLNGLSEPMEPLYKIFRSDDFSYITINISDIFSEENTKWQMITRINVFVKKLPIIDLELDFSQDIGITLRIEGEDRDLVFLLFSDLRQYIDNEVLKLGYV